MNEHSLPWRLVQNKLNRYPGGREIDRFRGAEPALDDDRPEAWIGSTTRYAWKPVSPTEGYAECESLLGRRLFLLDAIREDPQAMTGGFSELAVLAKLLDAKEELGFQCHPDREVAQRLFGSPYGKTEAWVVLGLREDVSEPPYVLLGFREGITRESFEAVFWQRDRQTLRGLLHKLPVQPGEVYFVGPGVPHAVGAGCFIAEVQEPSDITVVGWPARFGSEEEKALANQRALDSFHYEGLSREETLDRYRVKPKILRAGPWGCEELLVGLPHTSYFACTRLSARGEAPFAKTGRAAVGLVTQGAAAILCGGRRLELKKADEVFFPAGMLESSIEPANDGVTMLLFHPEGARLPD